MFARLLGLFTIGIIQFIRLYVYFVSLIGLSLGVIYFLIGGICGYEGQKAIMEFLGLI